MGKRFNNRVGDGKSEWRDSGKCDGRKSVKVGNGMGSGWADSGTGSGTGTVYLTVRRETREQKSVKGEVGKQRLGNIGRERKYGNRSRSRTVPDHFSRPDLYRAELLRLSESNQEV